MKLKKIVIPSAIVALGAAGVIAANMHFSGQAKEVVNAYIADVGTYTDFDLSYSDISANILTNSVTISDIKISEHQGDLGKIDHIYISGNNLDKVPDNLKLQVSNFKFTVPIPMLPAEITDDFSFDWSVEYDLDRKADHATYKNEMAINGVVSVGYNLVLDNITDLVTISDKIYAVQDQPLSAEDEKALNAAINNVHPKTMNIKVKNQGRLKEVINEIGGNFGLTPDLIEELAHEALEQNYQLPKEASDPILAFLTGFNELNFDAQFDEDTTLKDVITDESLYMSTPAEIIEKFNIKVTGS